MESRECGQGAALSPEGCRSRVLGKTFYKQSPTFLDVVVVIISVVSGDRKFSPPPPLKRKGSPRKTSYGYVSMSADQKVGVWRLRVLNDLKRTRLSHCRMIWLLPLPLPPPSCQQVVSLSQPVCHRSNYCN